MGGLTAFTYADRHKAIIVNGSGTALEYAPQQDTTYLFQSPLVNFFGSNTITLDTVPTGKGGTNLINYTLGDMLYCSATNVLSKLAIGTTDQVLTIDTGLPTWKDTQAPDLTLSKNFGTAVPGGNSIKLGNSAGTNQTTSLELYTSGTLKIFNTSNVNVATFTPVSNTCNLDLKGGLITTATLSTNTLWNGTAIEIGYGGTGLSSLSGQNNKLLQVNSGATGFTFTTLPASLFALTATTIHPTLSSYNLALGQATNANTTYTLWVNGKIYTNDTMTITAATAFSTGVNTVSLPSSSGQLALTSQIPTTIWSLSGSIISPASSSNYTLQIPGASSRVIGNITNPTNNSYPYVKYGAFKDLFANEEYVSELFIENHTTPYTNVKLTCNSAYDQLDISNNVDINGVLTATTSVTCNKFMGNNTTANTLISGTTYGWEMTGVIPNFALSFKNPSYSSSVYPFIGNVSGGFGLHINGRGDAFGIDSNRRATFTDTNGRTIKTPDTAVINESSTFDTTSINYGTSNQLGGLSRQGDHLHTIWTKAFRFNSSTTRTLYQGSSLRVYWDGPSTQIKFDILQTAWWDASIDHIFGTGGQQNPPRNTFTNDTAASGSGLFLYGTSVIGAFNLYNYATKVVATLIPEGLNTSKPSFFFEYVCGNAAYVYLIMKFINGTNNG